LDARGAHAAPWSLAQLLARVFARVFARARLCAQARCSSKAPLTTAAELARLP